MKTMKILIKDDQGNWHWVTISAKHWGKKWIDEGMLEGWILRADKP